MHNVTVYSETKHNIFSTFCFIAGSFYIASNATDTYGFCSDRLIIWVAWCEEFHGIFSSL